MEHKMPVTESKGAEALNPELESGYDPGTEAEWKLYLQEIAEENA
jgi:hypothetical protein